MKTDNPLALDNQVCFSLYATSLAITQAYKPLLAPLGLTYPQYLIMLILWEEDGVSLNHICKRLGQQPGALTPVLKRMEEDGFLKRNRSQTDERQLEIFLSPKGKALEAEGLKVNRCMIETAAAPAEHLQEIKQALDALRAKFNCPS
ncbi:MAG: MarR family transcriptional regulator [Limnobacter sp.]|nr:MarR family transcriptional regulator [Limnobacter sp.]